MKAANEVRVGAVVLAALALMIFGYFYFSGVGLGAQLYYVHLLQPANISAGADVRLQGVKIGVVHDVSLDFKTQKPLLVLAINNHKPPYQLRKSYTYTVASASLLGDHYVNIHGPVTEETAVYQPNNPNQFILASSSDLGTVKDELVDGVQETMHQLNITLSRINNGVLSGENQKSLTVALKGLAQLSKQASNGVGPDGFKVALGDAKAAEALRLTLQNSAAAANAVNRTSELAAQLLAQNRQRTNSIFINLDKSAKQTADVMESLNFILNHSGIAQNAPQTFAALRQAAENLKLASDGFKGLGSGESVKGIQQSLTALGESSAALRDATVSIKTLLTDTTLQGQFKSTFASLQMVSASMEKTSENINQASAGLKNVLGDAKLQEDLKASANELRNTLANTSAAAARVNVLLGGKASDSSDGKSTSNDSSASEKTTKKVLAGDRRSGLDFTYRNLNNTDKRHYGDLTFNASLFGGPLRLGLSGIGEDNSLTLQTGNYFGDGGDIRYGLYRSKLGLGADYYWKKFSLEGNLYDPNNASWNAYLGLKVTPQIQVLLGQEKNGNVRSTALGVRLTR